MRRQKLSLNDISDPWQSNRNVCKRCWYEPRPLSLSTFKLQTQNVRYKQGKEEPVKMFDVNMNKDPVETSQNLAASFLEVFWEGNVIRHGENRLVLEFWKWFYFMLGSFAHRDDVRCPLEQGEDVLGSGEHHRLLVLHIVLGTERCVSVNQSEGCKCQIDQSGRLLLLLLTISCNFSCHKYSYFGPPVILGQFSSVQVLGD